MSEEAKETTTTTAEPKSTDTKPTETTTDAKVETKSEATKETKTETKAKAIPEKYVLKPGEGVSISKLDLDYIENYAREQKLSQEEAQAVLDQQVEFIKRQMAAQREALEAQLTADPEVGGDKLQATLQNTKKVLDRFDKDGKLSAKLDRYGISKDPDLMRFFNQVGLQLKDDKHVPSHGGGTSGKVSYAKALYGDTMKGMN